MCTRAVCTNSRANYAHNMLTNRGKRMQAGTHYTRKQKTHFYIFRWENCHRRQAEKKCAAPKWKASQILRNEIFRTTGRQLLASFEHFGQTKTKFRPFGISSTEHGKGANHQPPVQRTLFRIYIIQSWMRFGLSCGRWTWTNSPLAVCFLCVCKHTLRTHTCKPMIAQQREGEIGRTKITMQTWFNSKHSKMMQTRWWKCISTWHFLECESNSKNVKCVCWRHHFALPSRADAVGMSHVPDESAVASAGWLTENEIFQLRI